jgi:hypothetical protein
LSRKGFEARANVGKKCQVGESWADVQKKRERERERGGRREKERGWRSSSKALYTQHPTPTTTPRTSWVGGNEVTDLRCSAVRALLCFVALLLSIRILSLRLAGGLTRGREARPFPS